MGNKTLQKRIGKNISNARAARGESQEVFAARAGVARGFLSDIERGARAISIDTLVRLCKAAKRTPNEVLTA